MGSTNERILTSLGKPEVYDLRVNDLHAPMGIDLRNPTFSWKMKSDVIGARQTAYCITVSSESGTSMWNTGWVNSDTSVGIRYNGLTLEPCTKYVVTVKIKDQDGKKTDAVVTNVSSSSGGKLEVARKANVRYPDKNEFVGENVVDNLKGGYASPLALRKRLEH